MRSQLLLALFFFVTFSSLHGEEITLPEGYELADLFEGVEVEGSDKSSQSSAIVGHECVKPWYRNGGLKEKNTISVAQTILEAGPSAVVAGCVHALSGSFFDTDTDLVM